MTTDSNIAGLNCQMVQADLPLYWYGELDGAADAAMDRHLAACPACQQAWEDWKRTFAALEQDIAEPSPRLLESCRAELHDSLRRDEERQEVTFGQWLKQLSRGFVIRPVPAMAGAMAMAAFGFLGARMVTPVSQTGAGGEMRAEHVRFVSPGADGQIRLVVEETRQREVVGSMEDDAIRGLLVRAAQDSADPGVRVETVELLNRESSAFEIRNALLAVLERDANAGVRLKAIEGLKSYAREEGVRQALSTALLRDTDAAVRMEAIETLMQLRGPDTVGLLQESIQREGDDYLRQRMIRALREMNASAGTF